MGTAWASIMPQISSKGPEPRRKISVGCAQAVADALLGQDVLRPLGVGLELVAQRADIDAQVLDIGLAAPHLAQDELVGQHLAGMGNQEAQQIVLARRELYLLAAHRDDPAHQIDREIAAAEQRPLALLLQAM